MKSDSTKASKLNFSDPANFISSPEIIIGAKKSLNSAKFGDGCPKLAAGPFNEETRKWQPVKINRTHSLDAPVECSYTLQTDHFSQVCCGRRRAASPFGDILKNQTRKYSSLDCHSALVT